VAAAECREVGPVVGVGTLGDRRVVRRREVVLNGSCELRQNRPAAFERLDRGQRVAAGAVSGGRADREPSARASTRSSSAKNHCGSRA